MSRVFDGRVTARISAAGMRGLERAARSILEQSQRVVPRDTGHLQRSGFVRRENDTTVAVGYDDPKATAAHENTRARHTGGRQAKFLEQPLNANRALVADSVVRDIRVETS